MFRPNALSCQLCGRSINGRYLRYSNGSIVCEQCEQTKPRCVRCNQPFNLQQLRITPQGKFCSDCLQSAPICDLCHEPIAGSYQVYNGTLKVCASCERTTARCDRCHIPSRQLTAVRGKGVCADCLKAMPRCDCCHIPILDRYNTFGQSPGRFCETCMQTRPRCGVCGVPINEQGKVLKQSDGETVRCGRCLRTAIKTEQQAEPLYRQVRALLTQELGLAIDVLPRLTLVGRARLETLHPQKTVGTSQPAGTESPHLQGFFLRDNGQQNIYIEHYLPQTMFLSVAAHELAHAWQSTHAPSNQAERIVEGFAEWAAYSILRAQGEDEEAERLTKRSDIYGEGLRYFLDLERRQGRKAVIERAKR